jgi:hypothetical protein
MKKIILLPLIFLFVSGCDKDRITQPTTTSIQPPPSPPVVNTYNSELYVFAGEDKWLPLPANFQTLDGYVNYPEPEIESYSWKNLAGPDSFLIENPTSKQTKLSNLKAGTYVFEFIAKLKNGLTSSDKVSVHVYNPRIANANEFVFQNLRWDCPWGCFVLIENFDLYISPGTPIKVFLKSANSINWIEAFNRHDVKYSYEINNNIFSMYSDNPDKEEFFFEVKIIF